MTDPIATLNEDLTQRAADGFGGAIIIEIDNATVLKEGYGWAERAQHRPFIPTTIAQIGSLTKQFTATAMVDLACRGELKVADTISRYLPRVPAAATGITLHQLLTHTAGLPEEIGDDFDRVSRDDIITRGLSRLDSAATGAFAYSNLGYSLLAAVIEIVAGRPLEEYLAERFFTPLEMTRTGTFFDESLRDAMAYGTTDAGTQPPISDRIRAIAPDYWNLKGNGGLQSTVEDMATWYHALAYGPIIDDAMHELLLAPHVWRGTPHANVAYGYGWFIRTGAGGALEQVSHTGSDGICYAAFVWRPIDRIFTYMVTNTGEKAGAEVASMVLRLLRGHDTD
jgi:CubicO group peptidase (beta-lactamase class C family)